MKIRGRWDSMESLSPSTSRSSSPEAARLWRPAAQRNLRNQWSRIRVAVDRSAATSAEGLAHATALVNAYLKRRYSREMDLGVLKEMPGIKDLASQVLAKEQENCCRKLVQAYQDMVNVVTDLAKAAISLRCFVKGSASDFLIQFCDYPTYENDYGDGGGIPVFSAFPISSFENLAKELVEMFKLELCWKRLILIELLSTNYEQQSLEGSIDVLGWSDELYPGEFGDMEAIDLLRSDSSEVLPPRIKGWEVSGPLTLQHSSHLSRETLEVDLTAWLVDVNIDKHRLEEIFALVEEEMRIKLS